MEKNGDRSQAEKNYREAEDYYNKALVINRQIGNKQGEGFNLVNLGGLYNSTGRYTLSERSTRDAYTIAKQIGSLPDEREALFGFFKLYKKQGRSREALKYYKTYLQYRDSIINQENLKASLQQEIKFAYEKKATADSVRIAEEKKIRNAQLSANQANIRSERTLRTGLYAGLALVIVFALIAANRFKVISRQKKLIEEQKNSVEFQKQVVEEKQKEIVASIYYAKRIQTALLPNERYIERVVNKLKK
jgi:tetratricopeptide (TPR) repeat protein